MAASASSDGSGDRVTTTPSRAKAKPARAGGPGVIGWSGDRRPAAEEDNLRILYVAYPLLTVSEESAGGAEQMLWTLEREIASRGVSTTVAASAGSQVQGELFITGGPCTLPDDFERRNKEHQERIVEFVRNRAGGDYPFDLVHDVSGSFWPRAEEIDVPVLATLHLPRSFYSANLFRNIPGNVFFNCVSNCQARTFSDLNPHVVHNGIALERFSGNSGPRSGLLWLGRICEEKAPHLALEIAKAVGESITIAGQVYPFSYHQQYFEREILPRLAERDNAVFIDSPASAQKRLLLRESKAVLITSQVDETSSLVAMEAAASGAPVIAFRRGALSEIVKDGVTGFLVDGVREGGPALTRIGEIAAIDCVDYARRNFSSARMAEDYERLYWAIVRKCSKTQPKAAAVPL